VPPTIDADDIAGRRAKTVDSAAIVGMITEAAYMEQNASEGNERAAEDAFLALPRDHASLEPYRATAEGFYTHTLAAFGIARDAQLSTEFVACLLVGLAERPDMVDLATHCLAEKVENMGAALMLLARLIAVVAEILRAAPPRLPARRGHCARGTGLRHLVGHAPRRGRAGWDACHYVQPP